MLRPPNVNNWPPWLQALVVEWKASYPDLYPDEENSSTGVEVSGDAVHGARGAHPPIVPLVREEGGKVATRGCGKNLFDDNDAADYFDSTVALDYFGSTT